MVAILYPRRLRNLLDVTQPQGTGLPDQGVPLLFSSNSSFVIETVAGGGAGFSLGASNLGNTLGQTGVTGSRIVLAGIGNITLSQLTDGNGGTISISGAGGGAGFSAGVSGGNTAGDTGATGTRLVFAGGQSVTLSQATDVNGGTVTIVGASTSQSVQTQNRFNLTLSGNTAGALAQVSSGTLTLAGGNGITLSQAGNAITISGVTQSVQPETQTFIGGISASDTLYTSGSVRFTGSNIVTVRSGTGQLVVIDASTSQSVQTQNMVAVTLSGNTSGAQALISSGTMTLAGGNNITVSQAGNAVTISGPNVGGAQTGISGLANSETTYTSGSVTFSALGAITIRSTTGQHFQFSVNSQSVQPETQTFIGGISASDTLYTSGSVRFTGVGGGVTVSSNTGQRVDISVAAPVAQTEQTQSRFNLTISGNTAGAGALISSGVLTLAGGNNITVSQAGNALTISGPNVGGAQTGISGIIASDATYTSGTVEFIGSNMITVRSDAGQQVVIDATQSVQPGIQHLVASDATFSSGTVSISGFGAATVNTAANLIRISVPVQSVQPETQTFLGGIAASDKTYTSGTVVLTGVGGGITALSNAGQTISLSVAAPVAQTGTQFSMGLSNIGNTAGDTVTVAGRVILAGGNGVTLSGSSNGVSQTITISGITQSVQTQGQMSVGVSTGGNTAGDTGVTGTRMVFVGSNNITLSQATAAAGGTITISGPTTVAQTNQTLGMYAVQNTTGQSSSTTMDARTLSVAGDGAVSVGYSNGSLRISAPVQSVQTQNVHNVTLSGNTAGAMAHISSGTMTLAGGNNITLSQAGNAVTISGGAGGGFSAGVSNIGNTQGDTGVTGTRLVLAGTDNITLSQSTDANGATVRISGQSPAGGAFSGGVSTMGNTAGATGISGTQMVLVGSGVMSLSQTTGANGNTVSILAPATSSLVGVSGLSVSTNGSTISVYATNRSEFYPHQFSPVVTGQQGQATLHIQPVAIPNVQHDRVLLGLQISNATNSSNSISISAWVGLYTKNGASISLVSSISTQTNFSGSGSVGSYSLYGGPKWMSIPWTNTVTSADYYVGIVVRTTTGGGAGHTISQLLVSKSTNSAWSGVLGVGTAATDQHQLGLGVLTVSTAGVPNNVAFTDINGSGSLVQRMPIFQLRSGTV